MTPKREPLFKGRSAPYPDRSDSEAKSKNILMSLLDARFVRGELRTMDKYPNADGILDITDEHGYFKGKIDVQLKTLPKNRVRRPSHACEQAFLKFCEESTLPVILIAVDQINRKAYWQHMNYETLADIREKIKGMTYSLALPLENCIDGQSSDYIEKWKQICAATHEKTWNYDALKADYEQQEAELEKLREKFGPLTLEQEEVRQIQQYLDRYNHLLDHDFRIVKNVHYPNYWKIGLGIMHYLANECSFIVYPIPYGTNETLIRQVKPGSIKDIGREFVLGTILRAQSFSRTNPIRDTPEILAYKMIKSDFEDVIKRVQFDVPDNFMANEYIHGFASRFATFLNIDVNAESYDLEEFRFLINDVLPLLLEIRFGTFEGPKRFTLHIDTYQRLKQHPFHQNAFEEARQKALAKQLPEIEIIPVSADFEIDILRLYINHLLDQGVKHTRRVYDPNRHIVSSGGFVWDSWNNDVLIANLKILMSNLKRVYQLLIDRYFPDLAKELDLFRDGNLLLYCLSFEHGHHAGPQLEYYQLCSRKQLPNEVRFCTDTERPFTRESLLEADGWKIRIGRHVYDLRVGGGEKLDIMFGPLPMHGFLRNLIETAITGLLKEKLTSDSSS